MKRLQCPGGIHIWCHDMVLCYVPAVTRLPETKHRNKKSVAFSFPSFFSLWAIRAVALLPKQYICRCGCVSWRYSIYFKQSRLNFTHGFNTNLNVPSFLTPSVGTIGRVGLLPSWMNISMTKTPHFEVCGGPTVFQLRVSAAACLFFPGPVFLTLIFIHDHTITWSHN